MKVYLVQRDIWREEILLGIFYTRELAEQFIRIQLVCKPDHVPFDYYIEEHDVRGE